MIVIFTFMLLDTDLNLNWKWKLEFPIEGTTVPCDIEMVSVTGGDMCAMYTCTEYNK